MRSAAARARAALLKYRAELEEAHAYLAQPHTAHLAEIDQILAEIEADIARMPKIPIRNLNLAAMQTATRGGSTQAQIITFIEQQFGVVVKKSIATGILIRFQNQDLKQFTDVFWIPV